MFSKGAMDMPEKMLEVTQTADEVTEAPYKLVQVEGKGRGLVATRTLEVGELVIL